MYTMITFLKDTRNGIKFKDTGVSVANEGNYQSSVLDLGKNEIYLLDK